MKRLLYLLLPITAVPVVTLASGVGSSEQELGFISPVNESDNPNPKESPAVDEVAKKVSKQKPEDNNNPEQSDLKTKSSNQDQKDELDKWLKELSEEDKKLFNKILERRKKKQKSSLTKERAEKLLKEEKAKIEKNKRHEELQRTYPTIN